MSDEFSISVNHAEDAPSYSLPRIHDRAEFGSMCTIYGVITPLAIDGFDAGDIVYIGVTKRSIKSRLAWHRVEYGSARKRAFMTKLREAGAVPEITPLMVVDEADADSAERDLIQRYSARGPLLNDLKAHHPYNAPAAPVWLRDGGVS